MGRRPAFEAAFDEDSVSQAPARRGKRREDDVIPTSIFDADAAGHPGYDAELSNPGFTPAFLYVEKGPGQGQLIPVKQGTVMLGRSSVADLRLQHPSVSRRHAQLTRMGERFYLKDLGSQNATFVNKAQIVTEVEVFPGDHIRVGNALLRLRGPTHDHNRRSRISLRHPSGRLSAMKIFFTATGVALFLIALGLGALYVVAGAPTFERLAGTATQFRAHKPDPKPAAKAPAPKLQEEVGGDMVVSADEVSVKIEKEMAHAEAAKPAPSPTAAEPEAAKEPARKVSEPSRSASKGHERVAAAAAPAEQPEDSHLSKKDRAVVLAKYEAGDVEEAASMAKSQGDSELSSQLSDFEEELTAAKHAAAHKDGAGAVKHYLNAMKLDETLSGGWGKQGQAVRASLSSLYTDFGTQLVGEDDADQAKAAFKQALKYNPQNKTARAQLKKLDGGAKAGSIDDAFGSDDDDAKPAPKKAAKAPKHKDAKSAIDDAFND